uniref:Protocadherin alpha subfamily C, 2 n=1 Tax=Sphenodon punctatus TaxID=8508 RepID=A0A8D0HGV3_SPHPU
MGRDAGHVYWRGKKHECLPRTSQPSPPLLLKMRVYLMVLCLISSYTVNGQVEYSIPEETERGVSVGNIAKDLGIEAATLSLRKFRMISSSSKQYFTIDANTGALSVHEPIDREQICELKMTCCLSYELVLENPLELYKMEFKILDINDHSPIFPLEEYRLNVAEFLSPGTRFTLPNAQDPDEGTNSVQNYTLSPSEYFQVEMQMRGDGSRYPELVLEKTLDREQQATHRLVLTAKDGGNPQRSSDAQVIVTVLDTNDNAPAFEHSVYRASILENSPSGTLVTQVHATDLDEGQNGEIRYAFSNSTPIELQRIFQINPQTGEVTVNGVLDVQKPLLELFIEARDKGAFGMSSTAKLLVEVTDVNNNAPEIMVTSLSSPIPEDVLPGTVIALLSVTDKDPGENGKVTCQIPANIPFQLRPSFNNYYSLVTSGLLDRELVSEYSIPVTVADLGSPPIATQKTLLVQIADVNDNPPKFANQVREVSMAENNQLGASLFQAYASDPDLGENGQVSYSLGDIDIGGIPVSSYLSIDTENGNIYAKNSFDFEQLQGFHFQVEAQDAGTPILSSTVIVYVYVVDENDHAPQILYPTSTNGSAAMEMIPRLANAGYLVTKVIAIDADSGQNAWLFYHMIQGSDPGFFKVELHSGEIRTTHKLGDDSITTFNLTVVVRDNGEPSLSSSVAISIAVVDRVSKIIPDTRRHIKSTKNYPEITLYLIIALSSISFIFLLTIIALTVIKCYRYSLYGDSCCGGFCGVRERSPAEMYKQANNNVDSRIPHGLKVQPHFIEVRGNGSLTKTYCYKACLTAGSGSDTFMFYNTGGPTGTGPHPVMAERHLTGQSGQSAQNLIILKSEPITPNEPKQPNPDWRYSASLRAGMQSAVHVEEAGVLRGGPGGPEQQWPTASSATTEPEGGEVSPPVGAGVNSNSWTFKYGPGNPKQAGPGELPDKFIIPGSPAIISIRQEPPNSQTDKSDFITFGKKEETKKKKKKKKGNKTQEKKEKGNSATDNSDQ